MDFKFIKWDDEYYYKESKFRFFPRRGLLYVYNGITQIGVFKVKYTQNKITLK